MARQLGVSFGKALTRLEYERDVTSKLQELDEGGRLGSFAGGAFAADGSSAAIWRFKGDVPADLRAVVDGFDSGGITIIDGLGYSLSELIELQDAAHAAALDLGYRTVVSRLDIEHQQVRIEVDDSAAAQRSVERDRGRIVDALRGQARSVSNDLVRMELRDGPGIQLAHAYGGAEFRTAGPPNLLHGCTSGFAVQGQAGFGVLAAAHCEGINWLGDNGNGTGFSTPWAGEHIGNWGDVEWHTSSHYVYAQFYKTTNGSRTTVTSRVTNAAMSLNKWVCRYGRTSGQSCGYTNNLNVSNTFEWGGCGGCLQTAEHMVQTRSMTTPTIGGDSGGPWWSGSQAWGLQHGGSSTMDLFSKIQNAELGLGVTVLTG